MSTSKAVGNSIHLSPASNSRYIFNIDLNVSVKDYRMVSARYVFSIVQ